MESTRMGLATVKLELNRKMEECEHMAMQLSQADGKLKAMGHEHTCLTNEFIALKSARTQLEESLK